LVLIIAAGIFSEPRPLSDEEIVRAQSFTVDPQAIEADRAEARAKAQWNAYSRKNALPIARNGDKPTTIDEQPNAGPTNMLPPGYRLQR
jgi:hypothetical protein